MCNWSNHSGCSPTGYPTNGRHRCTTCLGYGTITTTSSCSHGLSYSHYYCSTHNYVGTSQSHTISTTSECEHTFGNWVTTVPATCKATGTKTRTCTKCGAIETTSKAKLPIHAYGAWETTTPATCIATGTKTKTCTGCGVTATQEIPIDTTNGHNYVNRVCTLCGNNINTAPTLSVSTSNITTTTANIMASSTDADYDALSATLVINGKTYTSSGAIGTTITPLWQITGLNPNTIYSYTVTVTDGYETVTKTGRITTLKVNTAPVITINEDDKSGKTTTQFRIKLGATDSNGDKLTFTLYYSTTENGTYTEVKGDPIKSGGTKTVAVSSTGFKEYTTIWWYVTLTDGTHTVTSEKQSLKTYCSGTGSTCYSATLCTANRTTSTCSMCQGSRQCNASVTYSYRARAVLSYDSTCSFCGSATIKNETAVARLSITCPNHGETTMIGCYDNGCNSQVSSHYINNKGCTQLCSICYGSGTITSYGTCSTHSRSGTHYYCTRHTQTYVGTSSAHTYCSHGYVSQHDN